MPVHNHLTPTGALAGNQGMPSHLTGLFDGGKSKGRDQQTLMLTRSRAQEAARQYAKAQGKGWAYDEDGSSSQEYFDQAQNAMGISNVNSGNDYNQMTDWLNEQTDKLKQPKEAPAPEPVAAPAPEPEETTPATDSNHLAHAKELVQGWGNNKQAEQTPQPEQTELDTDRTYDQRFTNEKKVYDFSSPSTFKTPNINGDTKNV